MIQLLGFSPDLDPTTPGVVTDCEMMVPTIRSGMRACPSLASPGIPALAAACAGAATVQKLDGTYRLIAGTQTDLYEQDGFAWNSVTRAGAPYTTGTAAPWRFAQFGNATLAANGADPLQESQSGAFADVPQGVYLINVTAGGSGYTEPPAVTITGPGDGGATAQAYLTGDAVTSVVVTYPGKYTGDVTVGFSGGSGSGATASAVMQPAPAASIVETVAGFAFLFNTTDPNYGTRPDGWWCSALYDQESWVPLQQTQAANGRIIDTPGDIRAGKALGPDIVAYKGASMYYGTYQGPPIIWAFNVISTQIGAPCQEAVVSVGTAHYFLGNDNFYVFDGTRPMPIGDAVKNWFFVDWNPAYKERVRSVLDRVNSLIYWYYVSTKSDGDIDSCIVFNYKTGKWGRANRAIESAIDFINGQIMWSTLGNIASEWQNMPEVSYNDPFWITEALLSAIIDTAHTVQTLTGPAGASSLTTGWFGDDETHTMLQYVRPRFSQIPTSASMNTQECNVLGGAPSWGNAAPYMWGKFDVDLSARGHRAVMSFEGDTEILGYNAKLLPDGGDGEEVMQ